MSNTMETRTHWIHIRDLTEEHDIVGFGPVDKVYRHLDTRVGVANVFGCYREYPADTMVQLYDGVFSTLTGRRLTLSTADYKQAIREGRA